MWIRGRAWKKQPLLDFVRAGKLSPGLLSTVRACLETKAKLVKRDPLDQKRIRELLNFGHTVGHALESASKLSHGECVLWGMAVESVLPECIRMIAELGLVLPREFSAVEEAEWIELLGADKKTRGGKIEMSVLRAPGKIWKKKIMPAQLAREIRAFPEAYRRASVRPQS